MLDIQILRTRFCDRINKQSSCSIIYCDSQRSYHRWFVAVMIYIVLYQIVSNFVCYHKNCSNLNYVTRFCQGSVSERNKNKKSASKCITSTHVHEIIKVNVNY